MPNYLIAGLLCSIPFIVIVAVRNWKPKKPNETTAVWKDPPISDLTDDEDAYIRHARNSFRALRATAGDTSSPAVLKTRAENLDACLGHIANATGRAKIFRENLALANKAADADVQDMLFSRLVDIASCWTLEGRSNLVFQFNIIMMELVEARCGGRTYRMFCKIFEASELTQDDQDKQFMGRDSLLSPLGFLWVEERRRKELPDLRAQEPKPKAERRKSLRDVEGTGSQGGRIYYLPSPKSATNSQTSASN